MIILLSPAKSLDYETNYSHLTQKNKNFATTPIFEKELKKLVFDLKNLNQNSVEKLMNLSSKLAKLNYERFQNFEKSPTRQAIFAFDGDVYGEIDRKNLDESKLNYAQNHLRILSGLYGILRPLDLISPYRLEMGTSFAKKDLNYDFSYKNLYEFWNNKISTELSKIKADVIINLASEEYFSVIDPSKINKLIINIAFKEENKNGELKIIGINAKKARGMMANFAIQNQIHNFEDLKLFSQKNYQFQKELSNQENWVFVR